MSLSPSSDNSLRGFTVGITADRRWEEQAALFQRRGALVVHGPAIRTLPLGAEGPLRQATEEVIAIPPQAFVANTGVGVRAWFAAAEAWGMGVALREALRNTRIYARGPKASGAVHSVGLEVAARAPTERLSEAVDLALTELRPGERVLLQVDGSGRSEQVSRLEAAGAKVFLLPVYLWKLPEDRRPALRVAEGVIGGRIHAVTFTAGPAISNWLAIAEEEGIDAKLRQALTDGRCVVGCVGPVCAEVARAHGLDSEHLVCPEAFRIGPLVRAVESRLVAKKVSIALGPVAAVLSGTVLVLADGQELELSDVEARLLGALAARPNRVLAKSQLLSAVWGSDDGDPHTVEVAVARLRRRLGAYGVAVSAVPRRGYTLRPRGSTASC